MLKVMIVEDEDIIRKGLAYTIDWLSIGYVLVGEASDGEEGYEKILELKPDVVITDIMMPKLNGIDMLRKLKGEIKIHSIILTSYAEFEYAKSAIELKAQEYLMKPVSVDELKNVMLQLKDMIYKEREKEQIYRNSCQGSTLSLQISSDGYSNTYVKKAIEYMKVHYMEKISIESMAEILEVSTSYFSRKFKEETGHTYLDFLNQYRVWRAVKLLEKGEYRVYQISDMVGFTDYKHFCSVFKRYTNYSPTEFIKVNKLTSVHM